MTTRKCLADNLRRFRKENKISREELAFNCSISARQLSDIENCKCNTTVDTLDKLSKGTEISVSNLLKPIDYNTKN